MILRKGKLILVVKKFKFVKKMEVFVFWFICIGKIKFLVLKNKLNNIELMYR